MKDQPHFQNQGVALLVLFAQDKDRLAEFYRALGVTLESHRHPPCGGALFQRGECVRSGNLPDQR